MMVQQFWLVLIFVAASQGDSLCPPHWAFLGVDVCVRFVNGFRVTVGQGKDWCESQGSSLLRFSNYDDVTAFSIMAMGQPVDGWWSDLRDIGQPGVWTWGGDERVRPGALAWATEPTDTHHAENCVTMDAAGALNDDDCAVTMGYLCSYAPNATDSTGCTDGYAFAAGQCYFASRLDDSAGKVTWEAAKHACAALNPGAGVFPVLANFTSAAQLQGLQQVVAGSGAVGKRWVGLNDRHTEGAWSWADGSRLDDTSLLQSQWKTYPDRGTGRSCGLVHSDGRMEEADCLDQRYFVCQQQMTPDSFYRQFGLGCPSPWIRGGTKCYFFNTMKQLSRVDTHAFCSSMQGSLLHIQSPDERMWVTLQVNQKQMFNLWTGLKRSPTDSNSWVWDDGSPADPTLYEWNSQPRQSDAVFGEHCAFINVYGFYNTASCYTAMAFICEMDTEDAPCPGTWLSDDTNDYTTCYYVSNNDTDGGGASWQEAVNKCNQLAGRSDVHLVDITSPREMDYMRSLMTMHPYTGYWTDLTDSVVHGVWGFSQSFYGTPPPIPWDTEPNNLGGNENCALIYADDSYNDVPCDSLAHIACERPASIDSGSASSRHRPTLQLVGLMAAPVLVSRVAVPRLVAT